MRSRPACVLTFCVIVGLVASAGPVDAQRASAPAPTPPAGWPAVSACFHDHVTAAGIVGASLALVRDGRIVAHDTQGYQEQSSRRPVTADTAFHWASITKTFTAIGIMQLRDRGLLRLDDPIVRYVPEWRLVHNPFGDEAQVTIRHLLSHTSGLPSATWPWGGDQPWHPFEPTSWQQIVAMLPYTRLDFAPGSRYAYSNPGIIFLGRVIEALSGDDYETYITKNILMPLGMTRTYFDRAPYHLVDLRSHSYLRTDEGLREARFDFDTGITVSNGGLNAPLGDMARYLAFLLGDPAIADERAVLSRRSLEEMWMPVVDTREPSGDDVRMGLAFFVEQRGGQTLVGHSGGQNGFISHIYLHRASRTAYAVAFNTDTTSASGRASTRSADSRLRECLVREIFSKP